MRSCLTVKEIPRDIRLKLPVIPKEMVRERACNYCPYHAGAIAKQHRCMLGQCAWDDTKEFFHPVLRELIPVLKFRLEKSKELYEEAQRQYNLVMEMFAEELELEALQKDECYECPYSKGSPCIGVCWKKL